MRVALVAESFLPAVNGVTTTVVRLAEHLEGRGHDAVVIAPGEGPSQVGDTPVVWVPSIPFPLYRTMFVGLSTGQVSAVFERFKPDVVHLAAPVVLGAAAARAARLMAIPAVAAYQTDLAGFAARYGFGAGRPAIWRWLRWVHGQASLTVAPSQPALWDLHRHGIGPLALWGRGVDSERFHPRHRSPATRARLAPDGEVVIGYVGRIAAEKRLELLGHLADLPGCRVVAVGDGPARPSLERKLPGVEFLGFQDGDELAATVASLDVFVHTGADETFCQSVQEAMAAGVPVVAPAAGGPLDLVVPGQTGYLFPAEDPRAMRACVAALATDPVLRATMGAAARTAVAARTWPAVCDELLAHWSRAADRVGHPSVRRTA